MSAPFVHLHLHTEYSILDSIISVDALCDATKKAAMPAVAVTDICNLFGMVKFYKTAMQKGVKPLCGAEIWLKNEDRLPPYKLVLLCQNNEGYQNLSKLISIAYQQRDDDLTPLVDKKWLANYASGLIALSGAQYGEIGQALLQEANSKAAHLLKEWMTLFPQRFYLEVQRTQRVGEKKYEQSLFKLAHDLQCPVVATNDVVFLAKEDFDAHKARVCIQEGTTLEQTSASTQYSPEQHFKTAEQMQALFQDCPSAIANTYEIARRCSLQLTLDQPVLPSFPVPAGLTEDTYLQQASLRGLEKRLQVKFGQKNYTTEEKEKIQHLYRERLQTELTVINSMGFPGYFLIVADFIQWAKDNRIPVGPGRGSGAGSLVAYALAITDLDPIEYELLFERFLNPERVSMPDFDIDFCMDNRDKVIDYVAQRYGHENVSQIATFGTMAAKAVVRDVGRVLGYPYGFVDKIAKLIPFELNITLEKALQQEPALHARYTQEEEVKTLIDLALKLEGITRNVGKHAGGVVIAPSALTNFAPLYCEKGSHAVIQFDKDDVEAIGLVKFDFLGLRTLTIIDWAVQNANKILAKKDQPLIDIQHIPLDDPKTFNLLKSCATTAIFQLESRGMKELIKRLQPDQFEEIIALVALFRPGPLQSGMVDDFINRKHGRAKVEYSHPAIEPILKPTYGVILYQEQVMQIAQTLAGYTLGGADLLRRAMGKKKPEEMAKQRAIFTEGAIKRGVEEKTATYIFDLMEKFAGYGFNKSHSAAYALVSYQTAWLKAHFPSPFMAAVLSSDMNHTDKIVTFIEECKQCGIRIIPPNINESEYAFTVNDNDEIIYGLGAIKGVGEAAIEHIVQVRSQRPFRHFMDFCERIDLRKVNRRALEPLIKAGAFDCLGQDRAHLIASIENALKRSEQLAKNNLQGQADLFQSFHEELDIPAGDIPFKPWTEEQRLQGEKESLGMYLSGHPIQSLEKELTKMGIKKYKDINVTKKEQTILIAGLVLALKSMQTKNGERMAIATLDDCQNRFEVTIFPTTFAAHRDIIVKDQLLIVEAAASIDNYTGGLKVRAQNLFSLATAREQFAKGIHISLNSMVSDNFIEHLKDCLILQEKGSCSIKIHYQLEKVAAQLKLGNQWNIKPNVQALLRLQEMLALDAIEIDY